MIRSSPLDEKLATPAPQRRAADDQIARILGTRPRSAGVDAAVSEKTPGPDVQSPGSIAAGMSVVPVRLLSELEAHQRRVRSLVDLVLALRLNAREIGMVRRELRRLRGDASRSQSNWHAVRESLNEVRRLTKMAAEIRQSSEDLGRLAHDFDDALAAAKEQLDKLIGPSADSQLGEIEQSVEKLADMNGQLAMECESVGTHLVYDLNDIVVGLFRPTEQTVSDVRIMTLETKAERVGRDDAGQQMRVSNYGEGDKSVHLLGGDS